MGRKTIPVTVLSGTLGAGKTTVLNTLLNTRTDLDIAVLVNDMGEVNVDAERVAEHSDISEDDEDLIELSNGCICCELRRIEEKASRFIAGMNPTVLYTKHELLSGRFK